MARQRKRIFEPFPELVEAEHPEGPWQIVDTNVVKLSSNGAMDAVRRWIGVPLDACGRPVSRHELAHCAWSPLRLPKVRFDGRVLAAVEDARINRGLVTIGIPVHLDDEMRANVRLLAVRDAKRGDTFALVARTVASLGTSAEADLVELLEGQERVGPFVLARVEQVRLGLARSETRSRDGIAPFRAGLRVARRLARELRSEGLLDHRGHAHSEAPEGCCGIECAAQPEDDLGGAGAGGSEEPGEMEIVRAPMPVRLRSGRGAGRRWRAATEGCAVRYLGRWPTDKAIFRRRRRGRGGASVLVDTSGSMSIETDDLDRLLLATPAGARVAIYSGNRECGELRLVAQGNRRAQACDLEPFGRANVVDVPALEWLARQPAPRLWVSDGKVTGVGDQPSEAVSERVDEICRAAGIVRAETLEAATRQVTGQVRGGSSSAG